MSSEIDAFIASVTPLKRRRDAETLLHLFSSATGSEPRLWGTIVGYGHYHYRYESGREGDTAAAAFAPRKAAMTVYLVDGVAAHSAMLERLGPHTTGVGCVYIKDLELIDLDVLGKVVASSYETLTSGTYALRARDGES
ncbi:MAG: DUF1801 domain-containing protein [Salinibacterium sp.]|nr:DUF1801 domain-containing protein [Salinibacterium sp.]